MLISTCWVELIKESRVSMDAQVTRLMSFNQVKCVNRQKSDKYGCILSRVHIYKQMQCECERGMRKWEKCWCGRVAQVQRTAFVYVGNVWWTAKRYLSKLRIHLMNVGPNKSERVWANARCRAFILAVCAFPPTSTCDKCMQIAWFVRHLSGISFNVRSFTTYLANIGEWRTCSFTFAAKSTLGKCTRLLVFDQTHSLSV